MKKIISLLLTALMAISVVTAGAVSVSAAEGDIAFEAGSKIFFNNVNTKWEQVYFYSWSNGYYGDFVPMDKVEGTDLYSVVVPQAVPDGDTYFLFTDSTNWTGSQTDNQSATKGFNTYTPSADAKAVVKSYTEYTPTTEVAITPYSKNFTGTLDVTVYAFNVPDGVKPTYQLNDAAPVEFENSQEITLEATTTVTVTAGTATLTYEFTKVDDAVITVQLARGIEYTGNIYVYTYGGDRLGESFNLMTYDEDNNTYTYVLNGSAHVIFTTTPSWSTAQKFLIVDENGDLMPDQEPLVDYGQKASFILSI